MPLLPQLPALARFLLPNHCGNFPFKNKDNKSLWFRYESTYFSLDSAGHFTGMAEPLLADLHTGPSQNQHVAILILSQLFTCIPQKTFRAITPKLLH